METIGTSRLWSFLDVNEKISGGVSNTKIREDRGYLVSNYLELARKVSELQFRNREYVFLFRGQGKDFKNKNKQTSLNASLLRLSDVAANYETLLEAERLLIEKYKFPDRLRLERYQALRWALLQHYEVCATPLLDVTQSLRIAASFASVGDRDEGFVYVLGVPNISGAVTASAEAGIEVIRLSSVCPPEAVRPHIQEGFLLSEFPELFHYKQSQKYPHDELDFGKRLIGKFRFKPSQFWQENTDFSKVSMPALYPDEEDRFIDIIREIKSLLNSR